MIILVLTQDGIGEDLWLMMETVSYSMVIHRELKVW
jgi:hypothetical protein